MTWRTYVIRLAIVATAIASLITAIYVSGAPYVSGSWFDPRYWSEEYAAGTTLMSAWQNGIWMKDFASNTAPYVFALTWIGSVVFSICRTLRKLWQNSDSTKDIKSK